MSDEPRRLRAQERGSRAVLLKSNLLDDESDVCPVRGAQAVSLAVALTKQSWAMAGLVWPSYTRANIPIAFVARVPK